MEDNENWPLLISNYRKRYALTQTAFAERFNVSQQTVSRWESKRQSPHLLVQKALRSVVSFGAHASAQAWCRRIEMTRGMEALFGAGWKFLAVSEPLLKIIGASREALIGTALAELPGIEPHADLIAAVPMFDGNVRVMKAGGEFVFPDAALRCDFELWPVLTNDNDVLCHAVCYAKKAPDTSLAFVELRVFAAGMVMTDDRTFNLVRRRLRDDGPQESAR